MAYTAPSVSGKSWLLPSSANGPDEELADSNNVVDASHPATRQPSLGRVSIVIFWSLGCEASLLQLRSVQKLVTAAEANQRSAITSANPQIDDVSVDLGNTVEVLAVHTPRFPYEDNESLVRSTVEVEQIAVPVIHDPEYRTWNRYNPGGWPATVLIGKDQKIVGLQVGTNGDELLTSGLETALQAPTPKAKHHRSAPKKSSSRTSEPKDNASRTSEPRSVRSQSPAAVSTGVETPESFSNPTAIAAHLSGLIAIADTGNHRVLVGSLNSDLDTFVPRLALTDIDRPGGLAIRNESELYVIERTTANILGVDLTTGATVTIARDFVAPTALCVDKDGSVVVADAGSEQLFRTVVARAGEVLVGPIAGTGSTGFDDGPASQASLAQPVAVARSAKGIIFCDAASSNIRLLSDDGTVHSVTQNDFFRWGLVDGPIHQARLQRPSGLAVLGDGSVVVTDTGNNRLRVLRNQKLETLGLTDLNHPTGLATVGSSLVAVADSGNNRVLLASPNARQAWELKLAPALKTVSRSIVRTEASVS